MPIYRTLGSVPRKRHSVFRRADGALYAEELIGNKGFVGPSSLVYHLRQPTQVLTSRLLATLEWQTEPPGAVWQQTLPAPQSLASSHV